MQIESEIHSHARSLARDVAGSANYYSFISPLCVCIYANFLCGLSGFRERIYEARVRYCRSRVRRAGGWMIYRGERTGVG